jgi:hypothetical protein
MRRLPLQTVLILPLLSILALASCSTGPAATGGIEGTVLAGPTCPVESPGLDCAPEPWTGTVRATAEDRSSYEAETDGLGRYSMDLPPGTYTVVAVTDGGPPTGIPQTVQVTEGAPLQLDLEVDTGIR